MNPRVQAVKPNPDYTITLLFTNGETKCFDVKPYLDKGIFSELKDMKSFNSVKPFLGSIQWKDGQDFCPDTLYMNSTVIANSKFELTNKNKINTPNDSIQRAARKTARRR